MAYTSQYSPEAILPILLELLVCLINLFPTVHQLMTCAVWAGSNWLYPHNNSKFWTASSSE